jgi:nucleoside phosphorylase
VSDITSQPIVLVVAMESERVHLEQLVPGWQHVGNSAWPTLRRLYRNVPLILVRSGIGMVAAAAATEYAAITGTLAASSTLDAPALIRGISCRGMW